MVSASSVLKNFIVNGGVNTSFILKVLNFYTDSILISYLSKVYRQRNYSIVRTTISTEYLFNPFVICIAQCFLCKFQYSTLFKRFNVTVCSITRYPVLFDIGNLNTRDDLFLLNEEISRF